MSKNRGSTPVFKKLLDLELAAGPKNFFPQGIFSVKELSAPGAYLVF
jgi:hypothetical protein